jgi:enamine deaminase RidA (YjgF/YER057c/UK114 family)
LGCYKNKKTGEIRMTIQKKLFRNGPYADLFSQGVQVGNSLHLAGQVGTDATGRAPESLVEQMQNAYQHVESVLKEFDCTMDNVVEETWFVTDMHECMSQVEALFTARQMIYGKTPEVAQTVVQVVALVDPSFKIEIKCVAITE